jgi:hypothetical protein
MEEKKHIWDDYKNVKRLLAVFFTICGLLLATDFFIHRHVELEAEQIFGFYAFFGLIGSLFLVLSAKELRRILMRKEDYYGDPH